MNPLTPLFAVVVIVGSASQLLWPGWMGYFRGYVGMQAIDHIVLLALAIGTLVFEFRIGRRARPRGRSED
jgi:hypothetical protein